MSDDRSDRLFSSDKDSLGDGWGKRKVEEEPALPSVDWTNLPDAPDPNKKVRTRLATPAPGSQKESGLLDIRALADHIKAEKGKDAESSGSTAKPEAPAAGGPARLATAAKGSTGSGLIDVGELVRQTEAAEAKSGESSGSTPIPSASESNDSGSSSSLEGAASSSPSLSASLSNSALSSSSPSSESEPATDDELPAAGGPTMIYVMMGLLAVAVAGLAYYVLNQ